MKKLSQMTQAEKYLYFYRLLRNKKYSVKNARMSALMESGQTYIGNKYWNYWRCR